MQWSMVLSVLIVTLMASAHVSHAILPPLPEPYFQVATLLAGVGLPPDLSQLKNNLGSWAHRWIFGGTKTDVTDWIVDDIPCIKEDHEEGRGRGHNKHVNIYCFDLHAHAKGKEEWEELWNEAENKIRGDPSFAKKREAMLDARCVQRYEEIKHADSNVQEKCAALTSALESFLNCASHGNQDRRKAIQQWVNSYCPSGALP